MVQQCSLQHGIVNIDDLPSEWVIRGEQWRQAVQTRLVSSRPTTRASTHHRHEGNVWELVNSRLGLQRGDAISRLYTPPLSLSLSLSPLYRICLQSSAPVVQTAGSLPLEIKEKRFSLLPPPSHWSITKYNSWMMLFVVVVVGPWFVLERNTFPSLPPPKSHSPLASRPVPILGCPASLKEEPNKKRKKRARRP
jgi:hypothetical protein